MESIATAAFWVIVIQAASTLLTAVVVVCLPAGCLLPGDAPPRWRTLRNAIGFPLLGLGLLLSLPILPGPGNLLVLLSLLLVDFPAKRRMQRRLMDRIGRPVNWLRARLGRPALETA